LIKDRGEKKKKCREPFTGFIKKDKAGRVGSSSLLVFWGRGH